MDDLYHSFNTSLLLKHLPIPSKGTCLGYGLIHSIHDDALYYNSETELYVTIYVDDIKVLALTDAIIDRLGSFTSQ